MATRGAPRLALLSILVLVLGLLPAVGPARADDPVPPAITGFSPPRGAARDRVTIAGTGFSSAFAVIFGSRAATFTVDSDTQISATVPDLAVTAPVRVQTSGGEAASAQPFVVLPAVRDFTPGGGPPGLPVVIEGAGFDGATAVTFGGVPATTFRVSGRSRIVARVPRAARRGPIGVTTPAGTGTSRGDFIVEELPVPTIRGFAPGRGGPGTQVRIVGTSFRVADGKEFITLGTGAAAPAEGDIVTGVLFRGRNERDVRAGFLFDSATQIRARVPSGAASGRIILETAKGRIASPGRFVVPGTPPVCGRAAGTVAPAEECQKPELSIKGTEPGVLNFTSVKEGDAGTRAVVFFVSLTPNTSAPVVVQYRTEAGTATEGVDYRKTAGTLIFPPGATLLPIAVPVVGDAQVEAHEDFFVELHGTDNAVIRQGSSGAVGSILNDDGPKVSIADASLKEDGRIAPRGVNPKQIDNSDDDDDSDNDDDDPADEDDPNAMEFKVTLATPSTKKVIVHFNTSPGTATAITDYTPTGGFVVFPPGQTEAMIEVPVVADKLVESNETFFVRLLSAEHASIGDGEAVGTIVDDDKTVTRPLGAQD